MTTARVTLPEPEITIPGSAYADERGRSRKAQFWLDPKPAEVGDAARAVTLSVHHDKSRKQFFATLTPVTVEKTSYGTSEGFMLFSGARVAREPVARFSKTAIEAFFARVLAELPDTLVNHPQVADMFTDHETAKDRLL